MRPVAIALTAACLAVVVVAGQAPSFMSRQPPHQPLHSFPTRRSSDLSRYREAGGRRRSHRLYPRGFRRGGKASHRRNPRDRKSTRLNSSHTVISYAVFCLKKKSSRPVAASTATTFNVGVVA